MVEPHLSWRGGQHPEQSSRGTHRRHLRLLHRVEHAVVVKDAGILLQSCCMNLCHLQLAAGEVDALLTTPSAMKTSACALLTSGLSTCWNYDCLLGSMPTLLLLFFDAA